VRSQLYERKLVRSEAVRDDGSWLIEADLSGSQLQELLRKPGVAVEPRPARAKPRVKSRVKSRPKAKPPCVPGGPPTIRSLPSSRPRLIAW